MKKYAITCLYLVSSLNCIGQLDSTFNLIFPRSDTTCVVKSTIDPIESSRRKKYLKSNARSINSNAIEIRFYICQELFVYNGKDKVDTCHDVSSVPFTTLRELDSTMNEIIIIYTDSLIVMKGHLKNVLLYEELNGSKYVKYPVTWVDWID